MKDYKEVLKFIKANKRVNVLNEKLVDGMPLSASFALSVVAQAYDLPILEVINTYSDIRV